MNPNHIVLRARVVYKFILWQLLGCLVVALGLLAFGSFREAYSFFLAALICGMSQFVFTACVFRYRGARAAKRFLRAFILGEFAKLFAQGGCFVFALLYLHISVAFFLAGFVMSLFVFWLAPFIQFGLIEKMENM